MEQRNKMCGIAGYFKPAGCKASIIEKMTDIIHHRGPDDSGAVYFETIESAPVTNADNAILALGHRRLSIVDLSSLGHQPMSYADERYWLTYNGEVYNYLELRKELVSLGYSFKSQTDSEVILAAYDAWGAQCQQRFNGMWAFAIYDRTEQTLFLSRDRFGIKPLYYWVSPDGGFHFASEIKQFTVLPGWQAVLNHQRGYDFLVWGVTDHTDETLFDGVFQVAPGHCLVQKLSDFKPKVHGRIHTQQWYTLAKQHNTDSFAVASARFKDLLENSVRLRLRADVDVGSCLSGGLDSSSIVCLMNNVLREQDAQALQKTFSACSNEESVNERKWMNKVTEHTKVDAHYTYPELNNLFDQLRDITWHQDEPFGSTSIYAQWNVFKLAADNKVTVMLDGQGADEQLAGYASFYGARLADLIRRFRWLQAGKEAKQIHSRHGYNWNWILGQTAVNILPPFLKNVMRKIMRRTHPVPEWLNFDILKASPSNPHDMKGGSIQKLCHAQMTSTNLQMLLHWEDRDSMAHSIESRVPFLDYRLVEYVMSLPSDYKIKNAVTKRVLRQGMSGIIPDDIRDRTDKIGFATPEEIWMRRTAPDLFKERLETNIVKAQGLISPEIIQHYEEMVRGERPFNFLTWRVISFLEWLDIFGVIIQRPYGARLNDI